MICKDCLKKDFFGGSEITFYTCEGCGKTYGYMFTNTPKFCPSCSEKLKVCQICGKPLGKGNRKG